MKEPEDTVPAETDLVARLLDAGVEAIRENADMLSDLDRAIGDGDHGVNMLRGFSAIAEGRAARRPCSTCWSRCSSPGSRPARTVSRSGRPLSGSSEPRRRAWSPPGR